MTKETIKTRNYGIDFLRIMSMFMIVNLHILGHGGILSNESLQFLSIRFHLVWLIETICYVAVNCYALISGFVGINSKFKYSNIFWLWLRVVFYSVFIYIAFCVFGLETFDINNFSKTFFPVLNSRYWYFNAYFCLFFFIPILNSAVQNLDYKVLKNLIIGIVITLSVLPTIQGQDIFNTVRGYSAIWLISLYLIGAFIKKYELHLKFTKLKMILIFAACVILELFSVILKNYFIAKGYRDIKISLLVYTSPTMLLSGIVLLIFFSQLKINKLKKVISFLSPLCFSVYLIHEHYLVKNNFINDKFIYFLTFSSPKILLSILITSIVIFSICIFIDYFREKLFKKIKNVIKN